MWAWVRSPHMQATGMPASCSSGRSGGAYQTPDELHSADVSAQGLQECPWVSMCQGAPARRNCRPGSWSIHIPFHHPGVSRLSLFPCAIQLVCHNGNIPDASWENARLSFFHSSSSHLSDISGYTSLSVVLSPEQLRAKIKNSRKTAEKRQCRTKRWNSGVASSH